MFFKNNRYTVSLSLLGVGKALLDNYWVFTNTPLAGQSESGYEGFCKFLYIAAQVLASALLCGLIGSIGDNLMKHKPGNIQELLPNHDFRM